ncbi:hypothetical protein BpHYR1_020984 [Brachionus plicatilis]|uniref:Uncharacterized protein n=1 Tax=Brachionus plicatilis TaxID=10195 RepID=A0A3M7T1Q4_BRAPC|nr:hypothetical protein BpHYR1_020984 [Brachionus plicatilis]
MYPIKDLNREVKKRISIFFINFQINIILILDSLEKSFHSVPNNFFKGIIIIAFPASQKKSCSEFNLKV